MERKRTTQEVSALVGLSHKYLLAYVSRHPHLRPEESITGAFFWSEEEIQRLMDFRAERVKDWRAGGSVI